MLSDPFNGALSLVSFNVTLERPGSVATYTIKAALSNYARNIEGPEQTVMRGREFVISAKALESVAYNPLKRGDRLISGTYGINVIQTIEDLRGLNGELLGYRVRTT